MKPFYVPLKYQKLTHAVLVPVRSFELSQQSLSNLTSLSPPVVHFFWHVDATRRLLLAEASQSVVFGGLAGRIRSRLSEGRDYDASDTCLRFGGLLGFS